MPKNLPQTQKPPIDGPFLSVSEAAQLLTISRVSIRRYLGMGKLKKHKVGARTLLRRDDVLSLVREG